MNNIIIHLINNSISASWLIIVIIIFRLLFKKTTKKIFILLWIILGIRLIIPFKIESVFSLIPSSNTLQYANQEKISINSGLNLVDNNLNAYLSNLETINKKIDVLQIFKIIYIVVLCLLIIYSLINYYRFKYKLKTAIKLENNLYQSDMINNPLLFGLINPKIYLPFSIKENDRTYIMMHEEIHLKRKDYLTKLLAYTITLIYWFNPLIWLSYYLFEKDLEMLCDEEVIKKLNNEEKASYSKTLLSVSSMHKHNVYLLSFNEIAVKERIKAILNYSKPKFYISIVSILLIIIIALCFLTSPKKEYMLKATIPPMSNGEKVYVDCFIIPYKNQLTIKVPDNVDEGEIILESNEETIRFYIQRGLSQKVKVNKDVVYHLAILTNNFSDQELEVYINVKNADVAIEDKNQTLNNYDLLDIFAEYKKIDVNEFVYADDNAYGLNGVVEYLENDISYLTFIYDRDKFQIISIDTNDRFSSFSDLTYLKDGRVSIIAYDEDENKYYENIISFTKDENNYVVFKNETKTIKN